MSTVETQIGLAQQAAADAASSGSAPTCGTTRTFGRSSFVCVRPPGHRYDRHVFVKAPPTSRETR